MTQILQASLPVAPWMEPHTLRLPGTGPVPLEEWLVRDEVFAQQMAYRDTLLATRPLEVRATSPGAEAAVSELLALVLDRLRQDPGYAADQEAVTRPDGAVVSLASTPLEVLGRLVQEDLLILEKTEGETEHRLTAGVLCFPSNWTLTEKMGKGLTRIHLPVEVYTDDIARRVQRLFDGLRPLAPLMRANLLVYGVPNLFNPRREGDRHRPEPGGDRFIRVERQCLLKLPVTRAVVFSIHTYMVRSSALAPEQRSRLLAVRPDALGAAP